MYSRQRPGVRQADNISQIIYQNPKYILNQNSNINVIHEFWYCIFYNEKLIKNCKQVLIKGVDLCFYFINFSVEFTGCYTARLGAKVLGTSVLWYSSTDFAVLVGTQYSYF